MMHNVKIKSGASPMGAKIQLDDNDFLGVKSLDVKMCVGEAVTITTEIYPQLADLEFEDPFIFIQIGEKKYRLMECVGDD